MALKKWFSEGTLKHLRKLYPELSDTEFNVILNNSEINWIPTGPIAIEPSGIEYHYGYDIEMVVPDEVATVYNVESIVQLVPDEDGVIYYSKA